MAAKGTESKAKITEKILEVFNNSFINDKEIRIPMIAPIVLLITSSTELRSNAL